MNKDLENNMTQLASNLRAKYGINRPLPLNDMVQLTKPIKHNQSKVKFKKCQYLKMQSMNFRERALYELQLEKSQKSNHRKYYWVKVKFNAGNTKWYQCSKDIQQALNYSAEHCNKLGYRHYALEGCLINVPITKYHNGKATIDTAVVLKLVAKNKSTGDTSKITRSQITRPEYEKFFFNKFYNRRAMYNFMKHNYDKDSQALIKRSIYGLVPLYGYIKN